MKYVRISYKNSSKMKELFLILWDLYFIKRIFESLFIHIWSNPECEDVFIEWIYYSLYAFLIGLEIHNKAYYSYFDLIKDMNYIVTFCIIFFPESCW